VADFRGDNIEHFRFNRFNSFHTLLFVAAIKRGVRATRRDENRYYDLRIDDNSIGEWDTVGDCIEWVKKKKGLRMSNTAKLKRPDLEETV